MRTFKLSKASQKLFDNKLISEVEQRGEVTLKFDDLDLEINAKNENNGGSEWIAEQVIKAITYGFEPKQAYKLFSDQFFVESIDLDAAFRRKDKGIHRAKSRIIGEKGTAKKKLEELSGTSIVVSNSKNIVSIIGTFEDLQNTREAIIRLLEGATHESVYRFLETKNKMAF